MEEPGRLQSMGSLRVRHDWATSLSLFTFMHWRRKWQPTPVFLPGESQGRGSLVYGVAQNRTRLKWLSLAASLQRLSNSDKIFSVENCMLHNLSVISFQEPDGSRKIITEGLMNCRKCWSSLTWDLHLAFVGNYKYAYNNPTFPGWYFINLEIYRI